MRQQVDRLREKLERDPPVIKGRVPPHELDAEAAVISALLLDHSSLAADRLALPKVRTVLEPTDFYSDANRVITEAIYWLADRDMPYDVLTVKNRLDEVELLQRVGGASYLGQLIDATPAVANVVSHANIVRNLRRVRMVAQACHHFGSHSYDVKANEAERFIDELGEHVFKLVQKPEQSPIVKIDEAVEDFERRVQSDEQSVALRGLRTGYTDLDVKYRMRIGDLTIAAGRPGMGKTAYALNLAVNVAAMDPKELCEEAHAGVAIMSLEMPKEQVTARMVCSAGAVSVYLVLNEPHKLDKHAHASLDSAARMISPLPIWIDDTPGLTLPALRAKLQLIAQKAKANGTPLRLAVIDYLQLMAGHSRMSREQQLSEISRGMKTLAKQLGIHILALSQLNRGVETRKPPIPSLADLRESGALEQDADNVLLFYRHDYYAKKKMVEENPMLKDIAQLIIEKQRNGPTGSILLRFAGMSTTFYTLAPSEHPQDYDDE